MARPEVDCGLYLLFMPKGMFGAGLPIITPDLSLGGKLEAVSGMLALTL